MIISTRALQPVFLLMEQATERCVGELEDTRRDIHWHFMDLILGEQLTKTASGLSITYSSNPRKHIWTFASGFTERDTSFRYNCPCAIYLGKNPPSFVDNNFYCESGSTGYVYPSTTAFYFNDTLWDAAGCLNNNNCCNDTTQPWFYRQLNQIMQDDIEARICIHGPFNDRSTLIDHLEIYIQ